VRQSLAISPAARMSWPDTARAFFQRRSNNVKRRRSRREAAAHIALESGAPFLALALTMV